VASLPFSLFLSHIFRKRNCTASLFFSSSYSDSEFYGRPPRDVIIRLWISWASIRGFYNNTNKGVVTVVVYTPQTCPAFFRISIQVTQFLYKTQLRRTRVIQESKCKKEKATECRTKE
jgi:hypothetical protein